MSSFLNKAQDCGFKGSVPPPTGDVDEQRLPGRKEQDKHRERLEQVAQTVQLGDRAEEDREAGRQKSLALKRQRMQQMQEEEAETKRKELEAVEARFDNEEASAKARVDALNQQYGKCFLWQDKMPSTDIRGRPNQSRKALNSTLQQQLIAAPISVVDR
eukprot:Hpha_TRINITY_DN15109_c1_g1::TRINITY_DN15109_c1_g1_i1::g.130198::m.130198